MTLSAITSTLPSEVSHSQNTPNNLKEETSWNCYQQSCAPSCRRSTARRTARTRRYISNCSDPWSNWTWFATEGSQEEDDFLFFGYVIGFEEEWGYFSLTELQEVTGPGGLTIERDLYFKPGPFSQVLQQYRRERGQ